MSILDKIIPHFRRIHMVTLIPDSYELITMNAMASSNMHLTVHCLICANHHDISRFHHVY